MENLFAFTNIAINSFWGFKEKRFIELYFVDLKLFKNKNYVEYIDNDIQIFRDNLTDLSNEIVQIIGTTNQETINDYFTKLKGYIERINQITKEELKEYIAEFNKEAYDNFTENVKKEEEEYFKKEERTKYKHLEEYENVNYFSLLISRGRFGTPNIKVTNYNYFCIEKTPPLADLIYIDEYYELLMDLKSELIEKTKEYIDKFDKGEIKADLSKFYNKAIVFVEGENDLKYFTKAALELGLDKFLENFYIIQRGGYRNLDKIWEFFKNNPVEIISQKKILLYDCDTTKQNEDFNNYLFKRTIPFISKSPISKGIENLFPQETIDKAIKYKPDFIDKHEHKSIIRGKEENTSHFELNKDEKSNFCEWVCEYGTKDDFENFIGVFKLIYEILKDDLK
ncbi:MAG: hypothetical protein NTY74_16320 [Ignavibacteriae bacterium]|nr:hypothetical protein [Ignavibacteriota bacterium]